MRYRLAHGFGSITHVKAARSSCVAEAMQDTEAAHLAWTPLWSRHQFGIIARVARIVSPGTLERRTTGMIQIVLLHDTADAGWTLSLRDLLQQEIDSRKLTNAPRVLLKDGMEMLPSYDELGALSIIAVITPGRQFSSPEQTALSRFLASCSKGDIRLVPLSMAHGRDVPPEPLNGLVSKRVHSLDSTTITQLANFLLNLVGLRLAGSHRRIFISYKISDGKDVAATLAEGLQRRGYDVWRDELLDRDGNPLIRPGSEAQETIARAIQDQGFLLVVDSPESANSNWVHTEIETAFARLLPMLPVVVEDTQTIAGRPPQRHIGGQFLLLRHMQREVRVTASDQLGKSAAEFLDDAFFDCLERTINDVLMNHLRTRLALVRDTEQAFRQLRFAGWSELDAGNLVFEALYDCNGPLAPGLLMRLLVQCAPYDILQEELVHNLSFHFQSSQNPCQYAVLVYPTAVNSRDKARLLRNSRGHLLLLTPQELPQLPNLFRL